MPKRIIFVRHGETDFNKNFIIQGHLDLFLNPQGLKQAVAVSQKLVNLNIDVIFSSDLLRASQTAQIIAQKLRKKVIMTENLRERNLGELQGLTGRDIKNRFGLVISKHNFEDKISQDFFQKNLGMETDKQIKKRFLKFYKSLKAKYFRKNVLLVSHGSAIRVFLRHFQIDDISLTNTGLVIIDKKADSYILNNSFKF